MRKTIILNIKNDQAILKPVCYGCGYLVAGSTAFYKCHVAGSCPAVAAPKAKAPLGKVSLVDAKSKSKPAISYPIGAVVIITKKGRDANDGKPEVITGVTFNTNGNYLMYSVGCCSWFTHKDFEYQCGPTKKSLKRVAQLLHEEEDTDEE